MNLYDKFAKQFSQTRQNPWKGWEDVVAEISGKYTNLKILDLGCGNGRFLKYISSCPFQIENYVGVDNSNLLLKETEDLILKLEAENKIQNGYENKLDLNSEDWDKNIQGDFNLIVSFGLMHHINPFETRKAFLKKAFNLLEPNGILAVSYWQFGALARYDKKKVHTDVNKDSNYSEQDFILNFGTAKAERFCHFVTEEELAELEKDLDFKDSKTFVNDGRENNENLYRLYTK